MYNSVNNKKEKTDIPVQRSRKKLTHNIRTKSHTNNQHLHKKFTNQTNVLVKFPTFPQSIKIRNLLYLI